ncbi:MAG: glycosyltransferase [Intestinibaculum porci]|uniref:glycosyltransferase n=1 Tax=Intestinibaculum porci TaxID=2487118 RepID=UPI003EFF169B
MEPSVLVIILNYKTYKMTIDVIKQLKRISYRNFDILVVDNYSPNESGKVLDEMSTQLGYKFIQSGSNKGYAAGNNIGLKYSVKHNYDYSLILNNDIVLEDLNILKKLVDAAEGDKMIGCVGPRIFSPDQTEIAPYINRPSFNSLTFGYIKDYKERQKYKGKTCDVYRVYGCCMLLKNIWIKEVNYLDESTFLYYEELILGEKFHCIHVKTRYISNASVIHLGGASTSKASLMDKMKNIGILNKSLMIYLKKYRGFNYLKISICKFFSFVIGILK